MSHCHHLDDDCLCDVGFLGSIALVGYMLWKDYKQKQVPPTPPPEPPPKYQSI